MGIEISENHNVTFPGSKEVIVRDFLIVVRGELTVSLDAIFDFKDVPPELHTTFMNTLVNQRTRLRVLTEEEQRRTGKRLQQYRERKETFAALPWYKKLFAKNPWEYDED